VSVSIDEASIASTVIFFPDHVAPNPRATGYGGSNAVGLTSDPPLPGRQWNNAMSLPACRNAGDAVELGCKRPPTKRCRSRSEKMPGWWRRLGEGPKRHIRLVATPSERRNFDTLGRLWPSGTQ
jgi:hypothetical protein